MSEDYDFKPIPITDVVISGGFWYSRIKVNSTKTVPYTLARCEESGRVSNFEKAAGMIPGKHQGHCYNDSDLFKVIEGCAYTLLIDQDQDLLERVEGICLKIAAAQESDGYLYTLRSIHPVKPGKNAGDSRWSFLWSSHELYNVGHLYEAAVAYYNASGKRTLLDVAIKNADLLVDTFGVDGLRECPGHQEIEIGLVRLYQLLGKIEYLELAKFFLEQRGQSEYKHKDLSDLDLSYTQNHLPVKDQTIAVGHAVRAVYMYSGMADVGVLTGNNEFLTAIQNLWDDIIGSKLYLTGGVGARHGGESFGDKYELPNNSAYAETCAAIAMLFWSHRMFMLSGEGSFMDTFERTLYNGFLAGVGLSGDRFFYSNPLESNGLWPFNQGHTDRQPWFECSCCPTNIVRFIPSLSGYVYASRNSSIFLNLYITSRAKIQIDGTQIELHQETDYPWSGKVTIEVVTPFLATFGLYLRIPGWARNVPISSNLYQYNDNKNPSVSLHINGSIVETKEENGYLIIQRSWQSGDIIELLFEMPIRQVVTDSRVETNKGKLALERGPLVYCFEEVDNPETLEVAAISSLSTFRSVTQKGLLDGIVTLTDGNLTAIPYFAWANREIGQMKVWMPYS